MLHVLNAPSPAATASMAIGEILARRVREGLERASRPVARGAGGTARAESSRGL
jgi:hypothetical protein